MKCECKNCGLFDNRNINEIYDEDMGRVGLYPDVSGICEYLESLNEQLPEEYRSDTMMIVKETNVCPAWETPEETERRRRKHDRFWTMFMCDKKNRVLGACLECEKDCSLNKKIRFDGD